MESGSSAVGSGLAMTAPESSGLENRGTGAGGAATNANGIAFEMKTLNESRLLADGFTKVQIPKRKGKYAYFLEKGDMVFTTQNGLAQYMMHTFGLDIHREPDEAYLRKDGDTYVLKILEKKNQNVAGSVDLKLALGPFFVSEYSDVLGDRFRVEYAFCLSDFLKRDYLADTKKAIHLRKFNAEHNIRVFFGDDPDYFTQLDEWVRS